MPNPRSDGKPHTFTLTLPARAPGVTVAAAAPRRVAAAGTVPTVADVAREWHEQANGDAEGLITEIQIDAGALVLIVQDMDGELTRVPVIIDPATGDIEFGPAEPVLVDYVPDPNPEPPGPEPVSGPAWPAAPAVAGTRRPGGPGPAAIVRDAIESGRIHPDKAPAYLAELQAGGARAAAAAARLARMWPAGYRLDRPPHRVAAARSRDDQTYADLFGDTKAPAEPAAEPWRAHAPMTAADYRKLFPEPGQAGPVDRPPPIPDLAGYHPPPPMAPAGDANVAQVDRAGAPVRAGAQTAPGPAGPGQAADDPAPTHGKLTAWHTHEHTDGDGGIHSHQHVHRGDALHESGPGHSHDAPELFTDLAGRGQRKRGRPRRAAAAAAAAPGRAKVRAKIAAALATAAASPSVRVP